MDISGAGGERCLAGIRKVERVGVDAGEGPLSYLSSSSLIACRLNAVLSHNESVLLCTGTGACEVQVSDHTAKIRYERKHRKITDVKCGQSMFIQSRQTSVDKGYDYKHSEQEHGIQRHHHDVCHR